MKRRLVTQNSSTSPYITRIVVSNSLTLFALCLLNHIVAWLPNCWLFSVTNNFFAVSLWRKDNEYIPDTICFWFTMCHDDSNDAIFLLLTTGIISIPGGVVGNILSAILVKKLNWKTATILKYNSFCCILVCFGAPIVLLYCKNIPLAGVTQAYPWGQSCFDYNECALCLWKWYNTKSM